MDPGEAPTNPVNTTVWDGVLAGSPTLVTHVRPHPPHPLGHWSFREAPQRPMASRSLASPLRVSFLPPTSYPHCQHKQRVCRFGNCKAVSLCRDLCVAYLFIVCHPSDLLKQCVSYRFCSPAWTSLFCSSKQTFSIYRSVC